MTTTNKTSRVDTSVFQKVSGNKTLNRSNFSKNTSKSIVERTTSQPKLKEGSIGRTILNVLNKRKNPSSFNDIVERVSSLRNNKNGVAYSNFSYSVKRALLQLANYNYVNVTNKGNEVSFMANKNKQSN